MTPNQTPLIGFIGQGWIGRNYADDFASRGFKIVRYALEEPYVQNGHKIPECSIVFIAVPTPTTPDGFDFAPVRDALHKVGPKKTAVIKSTILPGTTEILQAEFPEIFVMHSPEFLREASAAHDAANPVRNIIGIPVHTDEYQKKAREVLDVLPKAPFELICKVKEAELIKYAGNCQLYIKVVFMNMLFDLADKLGLDWDHIASALAADPRLGSSHLQPVHQSGRGAGGHCFIKDFAAFEQMYTETVGDAAGRTALMAIRDKNLELLKQSQKDQDLVSGVYGG